MVGNNSTPQRAEMVTSSCLMSQRPGVGQHVFWGVLQQIALWDRFYSSGGRSDRQGTLAPRPLA